MKFFFDCGTNFILYSSAKCILQNMFVVLVFFFFFNNSNSRVFCYTKSKYVCRVKMSVWGNNFFTQLHTRITQIFDKRKYYEHRVINWFECCQKKKNQSWKYRLHSIKLFPFIVKEFSPTVFFLFQYFSFCFKLCCFFLCLFYFYQRLNFVCEITFWWFRFSFFPFHF